MMRPCLLSIVFVACLATGNGLPANSDNAPVSSRVSLIGTPLREPDWSDATRSKLEKDLEIASAVMAIAPEREDSHIWLGRRLGYLTRYQEAVEVFTRGLEQFPDSYKLLRFRGRHLARSRNFERAIDDYERAAALVETIQDSYEPDGIINARRQYLGSYRANIHYYLGQTNWAVGDYQAVLDGMQRSSREPLVQHDDRRIATSYWRYLALRKLGRHDEASNLVSQFPDNLELLENHTYYDGVLFFNGTYSAQELLPQADSIAKFAIAMNYHFAGEQMKAEQLWRDIIESSPQGFWPAETELVAAQNQRNL